MGANAAALAVIGIEIWAIVAVLIVLIWVFFFTRP